MRDEGKVFMQYVLSSKLLRSASLTSEERRSELAAAVKAMREDAVASFSPELTELSGRR